MPSATSQHARSRFAAVVALITAACSSAIITRRHRNATPQELVATFAAFPNSLTVRRNHLYWLDSAANMTFGSAQAPATVTVMSKDVTSHVDKTVAVLPTDAQRFPGMTLDWKLTNSIAGLLVEFEYTHPMPYTVAVGRSAAGLLSSGTFMRTGGRRPASEKEVKFASNLPANHTYELIIVDATNGLVTSRSNLACSEMWVFGDEAITKKAKRFESFNVTSGKSLWMETSEVDDIETGVSGKIATAVKLRASTANSGQDGVIFSCYGKYPDRRTEKYYVSAHGGGAIHLSSDQTNLLTTEPAEAGGNLYWIGYSQESSTIKLFQAVPGKEAAANAVYTFPSMPPRGEWPWLFTYRGAVYFTTSDTRVGGLEHATHLFKMSGSSVQLLHDLPSGSQYIGTDNGYVYFICKELDDSGLPKIHAYRSRL